VRRRLSLGKIVGSVVFVAVCAAGIFLANVSGMTKPIKEMFVSPNADIVTQTVRLGELRISVVEKGTLESSKNQDAFCNVEGGTSIIMIKPEGTRVTKGETVCELDSAALRDNLTNQNITTKSAEANFKNAVLTREVAEIAVTEYVEGIFRQEMATVEGEIKLAESELSRSLDRVDWAQRMSKKGYISMASKVSEDLALKKAQFSLEQAQSKKKVLVDYTKDKTIKELESDVEKARSDELAKKATHELEVGKEKKLERQIAACKILAPSDGLVVYANDPSRAFMSNTPQVEEGAQVRERQKIFSLPDISLMQVNTKVHESHINKVKKGMKAKVRVDAFSNELLDGEVTDVAALPDTASFFSSDIKVYTTKVKILSPLPGLRPGMNAEVTIEVNQLDKVLMVPVLAVLEFNSKVHLTKKIDGRFVQKEIVLGLSNEKFVEIKSGAKEGEIVAMSPISLMSEEEKRAAFGSASKPTLRDWSKEESADAAATATGAPGAGGAPGEGQVAGAAGKGKASGKARTKGAGGGRPAWMANLSSEERTVLFTGTDEEKKELMKAKGKLTDEQAEQALERMKSFGGGGGGRGGPGGGGGGGRGRGGFGGGPPGGGDGGSEQ
jgi:HlyD family secretion protein